MSGSLQWQEYGPDVPRFNGVARRLLIGGQRTNSNTNPRFEGATVGVIGSGGAYWTGGGTSGTGGLNVEIVQIGKDAGIDYVRLRLFGTPSGTAYTLFFAPTIAASPSQVWSRRLFCRLVAGSLTNISSLNNRIVVVGGAGTSSQNMAPTLSTVWQAFTETVTVGSATSVQHFLSAAISVGLAVEITIDLGWPQMELGPFVSTPILPAVGTPAASTRGADLVSASLSSLGIGSGGVCTILGTFMLPQAAPSTASQVIFQIDDGSENNRYQVRNSAGGAFVLASRTTAGAAADAAGFTMTAGTVFRVGASIDAAGRIAASVNGAPVLATTGGPTSGLLTFRVGSNASGAANMFGEVGTLRVIPAAVSDADLQTLVAGLPT